MSEETPTKAKAPKLDAACADAVDLAREAAIEFAKISMTVGEHIGVMAEGDRVATHLFEATHPGYRGWRWAVTVARASRGRKVTINEVVMLPGPDALVAPQWVPWADRIQDGDVGPGVLMPTPDSDPRLEPGFTGGELAADTEPAEASQARALVAELGLGRERVLSAEGRGRAAERWLAGDSGPDNDLTQQAPGQCIDCGYFIRLQGSLGSMFGVCTNQYSVSDARVVSTDHGCGAHSDIVERSEGVTLPEPVWDDMQMSANLFD